MTLPPTGKTLQDAFDGFRSDLPPEVARALEQFSGYQWNLLLLIHREPATLDLVRSSPALAWCLANCDIFRSVYGQPPVEWARWRVQHKQTHILKWLGFPANRSTIKLLRKLVHPCIDPAAMRLLRNMLIKDAHGMELLQHQARINTGVLRLCCFRRVAEVTAPSLVNEAAADPAEERGSPRADLLADTLDLWDSLERAGSLAPFPSLRRIQTVHDELLLDYQRWLTAEREPVPRKTTESARPRKQRRQFPGPPVPGSDDIVPLCSKCELEQESRDQDNCVGTYYKRILKTGNLYIYKVLRPQRATLSLVRLEDGSWCRGELEAAHNQPVSPTTRMAVDYWLRRSAGRF